MRWNEHWQYRSGVSSRYFDMFLRCSLRTTSPLTVRAWHLFVIWPPVTGNSPKLLVQKGEMAEWSKARAWKARIPVKGYRGFESLSLRHTGTPVPNSMGGSSMTALMVTTFVDHAYLSARIA